MPDSSIKTVIDQISNETTYFIFSQKDAFDKREVYNFAKKTYQETVDKYQLNKLQKVLKICQKKYKRASICFLTIEKKDNKKKIILCGEGDLNCIIKKQGKDYFLPIIAKGISGFLGESDKIYIKNDQESQILSSPKKDQSSQNSPNPVPIPVPAKPKFKLPQFNLVPKLKNIKKNLITKLKTPKKKKVQITPKPIHQNLALSYKNQSPITKKRIISIILASIFLLLLGFFIGFGVYKKRQFEKNQLEQRLKGDIEYRLKQSQALKDINPQRAKTLLSEATYILNSYQKNNILPDFLISLSEKVNNSYVQVAQIFNVEPELFFDLSLISAIAKPNKISLSDKDLSLLDSQNQILLDLNIDKKSGQILAGKDLVDPDSSLASIDKWVFLASQGKIKIIDRDDGEQLNSFNLEKITINNFWGYASNLYVLDKSLGQIWRFRGTGNSLSKAEAFFDKEQDFSDIASFSLDGSVWLLDVNGGVHKYTQGVKDAYFPEFGLDSPIQNPQKIFTDEYCDNFYILDQQNSRIIAISKKGVYQGQYASPQIKEISDFVVSEQISKILLSKGDKIYSIDLKQ